VYAGACMVALVKRGGSQDYLWLLQNTTFMSTVRELHANAGTFSDRRLKSPAKRGSVDMGCTMALSYCTLNI
jgi:hypothetical protein